MVLSATFLSKSYFMLKIRIMQWLLQQLPSLGTVSTIKIYSFQERYEKVKITVHSQKWSCTQAYTTWAYSRFRINIPCVGTHRGGDRDFIMPFEFCPPPSVSDWTSTDPVDPPWGYCSPPIPPVAGCPLGITGLIPSFFLPYLREKDRTKCSRYSRLLLLL